MTDPTTASAVPGRVIGVAIPIPEPYGSELNGWRERFGDPMAKSIPSHVTLLPPTTVDEPLLPEIIDHLASVAAAEERFDIELRGTGTFRPVSPVVFIALARGISGCERLEQRVRSGPLTRDLPFPYHPHVTVAHDLPDDVLDRVFLELSDFTAAFTVGAFWVFEHLAGVWEPQHEFRLTGQSRHPVRDDLGR